MPYQAPWPSAQEVAKAVREENERLAREKARLRRVAVQTRILLVSVVVLALGLLSWCLNHH